MYTTTSKQQEGCTFEDSHPKCFITTNSTAKLSRGAVNAVMYIFWERHIQRSIRIYTVCNYFIFIWHNGLSLLYGKLFLFHVLECNAIFANQDLLPTLRPGNFDLHTKMPGSAPAWAVVHKCPVCADLLLVGRRSERLCRRLVLILHIIFYLILRVFHEFTLCGSKPL